MPLVEQIFLTSGTWVCPAGITKVILIGYGGGGGAGNGAFTTGSGNLQGGPGGGGSVLSEQYVTVVPNTSYTVTIGAGGAGGTGNNSAGNVGADGTDTTFGSLATFMGAGGGYDAENTFAMGGVCTRSNRQHNGIFNGTSTPFSTYTPQAGAAGSGYTTDSFFFINAGSSPQGFTGGTIGTTATRFGGGGGGGGPGGNGGNGSNGSLTTSSAGGSGGANTGAGGGGAGAANTTVGTGGAGGSGKLTVIWIV